MFKKWIIDIYKFQTYSFKTKLFFKIAIKSPTIQNKHLIKLKLKMKSFILFKKNVSNSFFTYNSEMKKYCRRFDNQ